MLNPSGDLKSTQERLEGEFERYENWIGSVGTFLPVEQFNDLILSKDFYM